MDHFVHNVITILFYTLFIIKSKFALNGKIRKRVGAFGFGLGLVLEFELVLVLGLGGYFGWGGDFSWGLE